MKGGLARIRVHGNPGTPEGRSLGGTNSLKTHAKNNTGFKTLAKIRIPAHSQELAELIGILMGDGHLGTYQLSVATSSETDVAHATFIKTLLSTLFEVHVSISSREQAHVLVILLSSKAVCEFLERAGMPKGNKLTHGLMPPRWIIDNEDFCTAFLRGLVDTDGCVYQDRHTVKGKTYSSTCIAFTSASPSLLSFFESTLRGRGYHPTRWGRHIRLRRKEEVFRYAREIGFNNPKHAEKIKV